MQTSGAIRFLFLLFTGHRLSPVHLRANDVNGQKASFEHQFSRIPVHQMHPRCNANIVGTTRHITSSNESNDPSLC
ncbi:hypothetical protein EDB81DRAFT_782814 [Dactylonectria macrodidyma]|uniref:Secreted protein n=1 Tax=Dactylonectria macrodidyma TaxID=307937 RepID=A0A9P9JGL8_9HYPO|nr:hypothetical protein EDB81DRAFT_782814 [Dactylonectria macrodidyma]